jgi:phosphoglycerate kinase
MRPRTIKKLPDIRTASVRGKRVLVRVDFNEPVKKGRIEDSFRIRESIPTISYLYKKGATIILAAHLEDPVTGKPLSFGKVALQLERILKMPLTFEKNYERAKKNETGKIILLENIRFNKGEKDNDPAFARRLASLADAYVNEAFSVSHRAHASIVGVPKFLPAYAGFLLQKEVRALSQVLSPTHPFLFILGGAKFETKFNLLKRFIKNADAIFLGGTLANTFLAAHGVGVASSQYEKEALGVIQKHFLRVDKILLPLDARVKKHIPKSVFSLTGQDAIYDIGPESSHMLEGLAGMSRFILWNGPLGYTEGGYDESTKSTLRYLSRLKGAKVILGGGDTLAVLDEMGMHGKFFHVSTGGGAMLDFLADGALPGIDALMKSRKKRV